MFTNRIFWKLLLLCVTAQVMIAIPLVMAQPEAVEGRSAGWSSAAWWALIVLELVLVGIVFWISRRWHEICSALRNSINAVSEGDYRQRVYVSGRDQFSSLCNSFNHMAQELESRMSQLRQRGERQLTVLEGMIEGVIAVDRQEHILYANRAAGALFRFDPEAVVERPLLEVVRISALHELVSTALDSGRPQRGETQWESEEHLHLAVQATPLAGSPTSGVVLVLHDVSELRRLETMRKELVANVSHELKTPLSSIKAYAETLQNGAIDDKENNREFLARIEEQADRLNYLISDMISIARIESDQQAFEIVPVIVSEVVKECVAAHQAVANSRKLLLVVESSDEQLQVMADREGLREILENLIDNAIKYTPAEGQVSVEWKVEGGQAVVAVKDTGIGIMETDLPRVFERFYRVDKARSRELGGTGLGLAIVKHLTHAFGGQAWVDSQPGQGSTFFVRLLLA